MLTDDFAGYFGLFVSAFVSSTVAPGGSEAVLAFMARQQYSVLLLLVVATLGNTLGAMTTWFMGVWLARKYPSEQMIKPQQRRSIAWVRRWGAPILLLSWLPLVGDAFCFAAGWLKMPLLLSTLLILLGKAARYTFVVFLVDKIAGFAG